MLRWTVSQCSSLPEPLKMQRCPRLYSHLYVSVFTYIRVYIYIYDVIGIYIYRCLITRDVHTYAVSVHVCISSYIHIYVCIYVNT